MPDPARLLNTLRQAAQAFASTPGRRGRVVALDGAREVLATGDLHGQVDTFRRLLQRADLARQPQRHLVLQEVIHGPYRYPGGGDRSHQLVDLLAALKCQYPRQVHFLLGNHELAQALDRPIAKGDDVLNELFREGVGEAYGPHADDVYAAYLALFAAVPLALRTPNRVFLSHSLPSPKWLATFDPKVLEEDEADATELVPGGTVHGLLWGRDTSAANADAFLERVDADLLITGHIPCDNGYEAPNERQLILDCMGPRPCYCLFPTDRPLSHAELVGCVGAL
jgi:hypothetical protein